MDDAGFSGNSALDFDPRLHDLPLVLDLAAVAELFCRSWSTSEDSAEAPTIRARKLMDVKYEPATRCVAVYQLVVGGEARVGQETLGILEIDQEGATARSFLDDPQLPWLRKAVDPRSMSKRLEAILGHPIEDCLVAPVRYKPGARCVVRIQAGTGPQLTTFFGKTFATGSSKVMATIEALHRSGSRDSRMPRVVRPVAHLADLRMVLQPAVRSREVHSAAYDPSAPEQDRSRIVSTAGSALAGFHAAADAPGPFRTLEDDLAEVGQYERALIQAAPQLRDRYVGLVKDLAFKGGSLPSSPEVPSHGAFRTDQLLDDGDGLLIIDLDGYCRSSPARDIGNFLAYQRWRALRQPDLREFIRISRESFVQAYGSVRPVPERREIDLHEAASLIKIAGRRFRNLSVREWPLVPALLDEAAELLAG